AKDAGTEGTVYVKFVIEADGRITNVKAKNTIDGIGGAELVKNAEIAVRSLGNVTPAKQNDVPVRLERTLPISFVLDGDDDSPKDFPLCTSVKQAKKRVNWLHDIRLHQYRILCAVGQNDESRNEIESLMEGLRDYASFGNQCYNLSTAKQRKVAKYAQSLLKESALNFILETGKIPCWEIK
ncbi:MAG: energy transducer TonB, partial [Flavobacteriales bacterium]